MYISGFLLAVPEDKKEAYRTMAADAGPMFQKYGAIEIVEAWEEDVRDGKHTDFRMAVKAEAGEKIVFSWIVWPDKATADAAETRMMEDPDMHGPEEMPFDGKRMIWGGFSPIFTLGRTDGPTPLSIGREPMANLHGDFIWYELMTPDPAGAKAFYDAVVGWTTAAEGGPMPNGSEYRTIMAQDGNHAGGVLTLTPNMAENGVRPAWFGYIGVDNVDEVVARAQEKGATLFMGPMDMEGVGRMAMLADPQGMPFYVMRGFPSGESKAWQMMTPGHVAWNELNTPDFEGSRAFYYDLFDWTDGEAMPMGELGTYQMIDQNGRSIGAVSPVLGEVQPGWAFYIAVDDIDRACAAITEQGGSLLQEPQEIPGGMFSTYARDPQGAAFAIVGERKG